LQMRKTKEEGVWAPYWGQEGGLEKKLVKEKGDTLKRVGFSLIYGKGHGDRSKAFPKRPEKEIEKGPQKRGKGKQEG